MKYTLATLATLATTILAQGGGNLDPSAVQNSAAVTACNTARGACEGTPNSNKASCAADYAKCLPKCEGALFACRAQGAANAPQSAECTNAYTVCLQGAYFSNSTMNGGGMKNGTVTTTVVVDSYTTYCPAATMITQGKQTYTVTAPGTVTITNCPCTVVTTVPAMPVSMSSAVVVPPPATMSPPVASMSVPAKTMSMATATGPVQVSATASMPAQYTGTNAGNAAKPVGGLLALVLGAAALL